MQYHKCFYAIKVDFTYLNIQYIDTFVYKDHQGKVQKEGFKRQVVFVPRKINFVLLLSKQEA